MLGIEPRAARAGWTVFLVALLLAVLYLTRAVLLVFVLAVLFAYLISPVVDLVQRLAPRRLSRTWSLALVYTLLITALVTAGTLVGNRAAREASAFAERFPALVNQVEASLESPSGPAWLQPVKHYALGQIRERAQDFGQAVLPLVQRATSRLASLVGSVITIVLIPILGFFFLKDGSELKQSLIRAAPEERRPVIEAILADVHVTLGQFIRALVILAAATFAFYSLFFLVIGMPYGVLLATVAAALEFIPVFGPLTASVLVIIVALFTGFGHVLLIIGFLAGYRLFQDYILSPHLMSSGVALHPLLVIFGALAGEEIGGIPGMFLAIPVMATLRIVYVRASRPRAAAANE